MSSELEDLVIVLCLAVGEVVFTRTGPDIIGLVRVVLPNLEVVLGDLGTLGDRVFSGSDILRVVVVCGFQPPLKAGVTCRVGGESTRLLTSFGLVDTSTLSPESELVDLFKDDCFSSPEIEPVELLLKGPVFLVEVCERSLSTPFLAPNGSNLSGTFFRGGVFFSRTGSGGGSVEVGDLT